ncbi:MAG TPA: NAD(P)H-binding protein [Thermoleophilaceae bacterium]|nr:NAD(P)H-binding protein [Thermoleophilaceae bacterium]
MNNHTKPTLVIGGTGKTGRRVAKRLERRGIPIRIGSRSADPPFDWTDRDTWAPALHGARAAYISYYPDIAIPGAVEAVTALAATALEQGVRRLVLLSGRGEEEAQRAERALRDSGADWTIVRCSWFNQNFSDGVFAEMVAAAEVVLPATSVPEPFVDVEDIADVAALALSEDGHVGQVYELTGPRLLTFEEAVDEIAAAAGREVRYVPVSMDEFAAGAVEQGVPEDIVEFLAYLLGEVLDGRNANLTDGVQRALGREPRDFSEFAREAAASGVWDGAREAA